MNNKQMFVFVWSADRLFDRGGSFTFTEMLKMDTGLSRGTVASCLEYARMLGFISRVNGKGRSITYRKGKNFFLLRNYAEHKALLSLHEVKAIKNNRMTIAIEHKNEKA